MPNYRLQNSTYPSYGRKGVRRRMDGRGLLAIAETQHSPTTILGWSPTRSTHAVAASFCPTCRSTCQWARPTRSHAGPPISIMDAFLIGISTEASIILQHGRLLITERRTSSLWCRPGPRCAGYRLAQKRGHRLVRRLVEVAGPHPGLWLALLWLHISDFGDSAAGGATDVG